MLSVCVFILCSASTVLGQDTAKFNPFNSLLSQVNYLPGLQMEKNQPQVVSEARRPSSYDNCPANKVLQKIEVILLKVLNDEYDKNLASNQFGNMNTLTNGAEKLVVPLSKINSLKDLLENNRLQRKLRTKVTVKYELPSVEELNCKQALTEILQVLREAKLMHEYYRTCTSVDNCPVENVVDIKSSGDNNVLNTAINQGNNLAPNKFATLETEQNSVKFNNAKESNQDLNMKNLLSNRDKEIMALLQKYRTSEQLNLLNDTVSKELLQKLNFQSESITDGTKNLPTHNKITFEQILNPSIETNNQNTNISDLIAQALLNREKDSLKLDQNVDKKSDSLVATGTNDLKIFSLYPSENGENVEADSSDGINTNTNIDVGVSDNDDLTNNAEIQKNSITKNVIGSISDYTNGNRNVSNGNVLSVLDVVKKGADYNQVVSSMLQYQQLNPQTPLQQYNGNNYPGLPLVMKGGKFLSPYQYPAGSVHQPSYQINPYRYPNLNMLNNNPKTLNNHNVMYQTSSVKMNPFLANPKLINNVQQVGQQIYEPHNLLNLQRLFGVTDQNKLNFATDNNGIVELTYMLKQPNPVVYQPVYYVKYRLPYDAFITNLKELLIRKPHLRTDPSKLYQEMIAVSSIAEVSPNLKGVGKDKLTQMVTTNGSLVKTKVLKVNDTLLRKQLETVQNLNSILTPREIVNLTYSVQVNANKKAENSAKVRVLSDATDSKEFNIKYLKHVLDHDKTLRKDLDVVTTPLPPYTKLVQDFTLPNIPTLR